LYLEIGMLNPDSLEKVVDRLIRGFQNRPKAGSLLVLSPQINSTASIALSEGVPFRATGGTPATAFRSNNRWGIKPVFLQGRVR
jgi:hypothetical protein